MKIRLFVFFVVVLMLFLVYRAYNKYVIDSSLKSVVWYDLGNAVDNYLKDADPSEVSDRDLFLNFLSGKERYKELVDNLENLDFRMLYFNNKLYIYNIGYDQNDDFASKYYVPSKVGYIRSFFIDGDIILFQKDWTLKPHKEIESPPLPPSSPPDSVVEYWRNQTK